jgi:hypothetical protein
VESLVCGILARLFRSVHLAEITGPHRATGALRYWLLITCAVTPGLIEDNGVTGLWQRWRLKIGRTGVQPERN